jgi:hypothetical protein
MGELNMNDKELIKEINKILRWNTVTLECIKTFFDFRKKK